MTSITSILTRIAQRFLRIGPADEPVAWFSLIATALLAYQEAVTTGLGLEDAIVGAAIAAITVLVRNDVTPSAHLPKVVAEATSVEIPAPYFPDGP